MRLRTSSGDTAWWVKVLAALAMLLIWVPFVVSETLNTLLMVAGFFLAVVWGIGLFSAWVFKG